MTVVSKSRGCAWHPHFPLMRYDKEKLKEAVAFAVENGAAAAEAQFSIKRRAIKRAAKKEGVAIKK